MGSLEIKPEDVTPIDRTVHERLMKPIPRPQDLLEELKSILAELHTVAENVNCLIPRVRAAANAFVDPGPDGTRMEEIVDSVAKQFSVSPICIRSHRRMMSIVRPRHIAMYLCRTLTTRSLSEIGHFFSGKDHTTVLHAVRAMEDLRRHDAQFSREIELLAEKIVMGKTG